MEEQFLEVFRESTGIAGCIIGLIGYLYMSLTIYMIAKKTDQPLAWLAWIPFAQYALLLMVGRKPLWWIALTLLMAVPILNVLVALVIIALSVITMMAVAEARNKPAWVGILAVIPFVSIFAFGYLAFAD